MIRNTGVPFGPARSEPHRFPGKVDVSHEDQREGRGCARRMNVDHRLTQRGLRQSEVRSNLLDRPVTNLEEAHRFGLELRSE